jgi:RecJ-like exonuclease
LKISITIPCKITLSYSFKQENRLQKLIDRKCKYLEENSVLEKELDSVLNNLKQESKLNQILNDLIDIDAISKQFPKFQKMCGESLYFNI